MLALRMLNVSIRRRIESSQVKQELNHLAGPNGWVLGYLADHEDADVYQRDLEKELCICRSAVSPFSSTKSVSLPRDASSISSSVVGHVDSSLCCGIAINFVVGNTLRTHHSELRKGVDELCRNRGNRIGKDDLCVRRQRSRLCGLGTLPSKDDAVSCCGQVLWIEAFVLGSTAYRKNLQHVFLQCLRSRFLEGRLGFFLMSIVSLREKLMF